MKNSTCFTVSSSESRSTSAGVRVNMIIACSSVLAWVRVTFNAFCKIIKFLCKRFICLIGLALSSKHNTCCCYVIKILSFLDIILTITCFTVLSFISRCTVTRVSISSIITRSTILAGLCCTHINN